MDGDAYNVEITDYHNEVAQGKRRVTADTALRLERLFWQIGALLDGFTDGF